MIDKSKMIEYSEILTKNAIWSRHATRDGGSEGLGWRQVSGILFISYLGNG